MHNSEISRCSKFISHNKWTEAAGSMKALGQTSSDSPRGSMKEIFQYVSSDYLSREGDASVFLIELFRYLRNSATSVENQNLIGSDELLREVGIILQSATDHPDRSVLIKIILQFLVNLVVSNQSTSLKVSNVLYENILDCFYKRKNTYEVLALVYNLHLQNRVLSFREEFYGNVLEFVVQNDSEYAQFLAELFLSCESFWNHFDKLKVDSRIVVLELLKTRWIERKLEILPDNSVKILSKRFWTSENIIFQTLSSNDGSLEPYEVSLLLDTLGCLCGNVTYLESLQEDTDLIIRCGVLLINIHRLGKQSENYFSSVQKLSELKQPSEVIQEHPAFGFKVGLVRLIGNLCWKSKKMQDLVRETEIIPVLLDCCNIDARNPLIMQWVILTIRNLCENNMENQRIIAGLHKEGTVSSALVEEMGLTLHDDEKGGIRIVPLNMNK